MENPNVPCGGPAALPGAGTAAFRVPCLAGGAPAFLLGDRPDFTGGRWETKRIGPTPPAVEGKPWREEVRP
ncbi:uncharacterized protein STAUR_8281 [Stigmatella aurantiaca DW4/3-1]|uniref:Uncharacterized protein n=1 Tax=Stigmatella aurantiaca (strain DW4/3-1) TaxID=378806 RepID=E3FWC9_STIAD|nr:uncharacterized protein STAUR_8281 [Stigmatella aurantiaca DW4/3-1]